MERSISIDNKTIQDKAKELNNVMCNEEFTIEERQAYIDTLTEEEMRGILKEVMTVFISKK